MSMAWEAILDQVEDGRRRVVVTEKNIADSDLPDGRRVEVILRPGTDRALAEQFCAAIEDVVIPEDDPPRHPGKPRKHSERTWEGHV